MNADLFRQEAFDANRTSWMGAISLVRPIGMRLMATLVVLIGVAVCVFLICATYTRRTEVTGYLVPAQGLITALAPATGIVIQVDVHEGERVRPGQMLAAVKVSGSTRSNGDTATALEQRIQRRRQGLETSQVAREALLASQESGLRTQLQTANTELGQIESEIGTRRQQVRIETEALNKLQQLQGEKFVSLMQIKQQESTVLDQLSTVQSLSRQATGIRRTIEQFQQGLREIPSRREASQSKYEGDLAQLDQERVETAARGTSLSVAPVGGVVATQIVKVGQSVQAGQPLLTVLPGGSKLEAELFVPSRAIGFVAAGDRVQLRYQAYPYQKFGHQEGRIVRISQSALSPRELVALNANVKPEEPYYRITVGIAKQAVSTRSKVVPLKPGMLLEAEILGESRRLVEWIFEPVYSLG